MQGKLKFLLNIFIVCLMWYIPFKVVKSVKKQNYLDHRFDAFVGDVNYYAAEEVISDLKKAAIENRVKKEITIGINSPGGSVHAGLEILSEMKHLQSKGYKLKCYVGNAYSMGFVLLAYCDERIGKYASTFMHHLTQIGYGRPKRTKHNKKTFKALDFFDSLLIKDIGKGLKLKDKELFKIIKDDKWWSAKDALKANIIDKIENFTFYKKKYRILISFLERSNGKKIGRSPQEVGM